MLLLELETAGVEDTFPLLLVLREAVGLRDEIDHLSIWTAKMKDIRSENRISPPAKKGWNIFTSLNDLQTRTDN